MTGLYQSGSGGWIRTNDLRVMSPTSYQTAPPRIKLCVESKATGKLLFSKRFCFASRLNVVRILRIR